jgi:DNA-binding Xre family transcriptional regulator
MSKNTGKIEKFRRKNLRILANVHRTYVGMIEQAEKNITLRNMEKIADALDVEIADLLVK